MKRGNIRTKKDYKNGKYKIQGRRRGLWIDVWDDERTKRGLPKDLIFDLEYDACGYLLGFVDWMETQSVINHASTTDYKKVKAKKVNKKKRKQRNQSKRRNRKK